MAEFNYPDARRLDLAEEIFGHTARDPYRWLEELDSAETRDWLAAEDSLFASYAASLPGRDGVAERVFELMRSGMVGAPAWRGDRRFFMRRTADQDHAVLFTAVTPPGAAAPAGQERVLIDPIAIDASGNTTLDSWQPDKQGELLAYQLSEGGDEESVLRVMDVATGEIVDGPIGRCRYSPIAWLPGTSRGPADKAFYYVRRLAPEAVPEGEQQYHRRVYLHRVGTPADEDIVIFGEGMDKTNYFGVSVSRDGRWLTVSAALGTAPRNDLWLADLTASAEAEDKPEFRVVQQGVDARTAVHVGRDGRLYVYSNAGAPRGRLAVTGPAQPTAGHWRGLIGERADAVLDDFAILDGPELDRPQLLVAWKRHAISEITVHDLASGEQTGTVPLPGLGAVGSIAERPEGGHEAWFSYTDNTTPVVIQRYDARSGEVTTWERAPGTVQVPSVRTELVTYKSKDGTSVRMLIVSGGQPGSPRPAILYGYGGFGLSLTPTYAASILAWVEAGGVYAIASLRGGGEEGEQWHRAGMREHKQDVFDDFHAAAETLIADGWTTPGQLAVSGGSNGGLLVGAAITQRPELYSAAICSAPLLDMVRYEKFGLGQTWNDEYGTAANPQELGWLLSYSPYHHVREGTAYPAVLFTTFDSDTRVDPMHARKMCAALQHASAASTPSAAAPGAGLPGSDAPGKPAKPVLLRRESSAGHGARAVSRSVNLLADTLAFAAFHTGHTTLGKPAKT
ncbi:MAG TPA: prolyl oligopeptidase family serine peptidase [Streptosporangiaceae bacterium]|jgi:prolyl oligopeptidase